MRLQRYLKECDQWAQNQFEHHEKLLDERNDEQMKLLQENTRLQRALDEAEKELEKVKNNENKELERLRLDNTKIHQFLEKKKKDVQKHYNQYEKQLEDKATMIASLKELNTMLSDRGRHQDETKGTFC